MNAIGARDTLKGASFSLSDPFNYPSINRNMCMSMNTISAANDYVKTKVASFTTSRRQSSNLMNGDIPGKYLANNCLKEAPLSNFGR
jgi:hypothetical protein